MTTETIDKKNEETTSKKTGKKYTKKTTPKTEEVIKEETTEKTTRSTSKRIGKTKATINKELRMNAGNIDIEIESLIGGDVFYVSRRTGEVLELNETGSRDVVSLELLIDINKRNKSLLTKLVIGIVDIYSNESYSLKDVISFLDLEDYYIFNEMNIEEIDSFILDTDLSDFVTKFNDIKRSEVKDRIVERSIALHLQGLLDSTSKKSELEEYSRNPYLYRNI